MVIGVMVFCSNVNGAVKTWIGYSSEYWSDPNNWSPVGVPESTDDVVFDINAANYCILDINTSIHGLYIDELFEGSLLNLQPGFELSISGNIYIGNTTSSPWINNCTIILNGTLDQTIKIEDSINWEFSNLTINKTSGTVILNSDITITGTFNIISGNIDCNGFSGPCPPPCTPPVTGGIYHIANDFFL